MLIWESDWPSDFNLPAFGITNELVSNLLDRIELVAAESDSCSFDLLIFNTLLFDIFICHELWLINLFY
jgi:hypothetical protein